MKILFENWRKYLNEENEVTVIKERRRNPGTLNEGVLDVLGRALKMPEDFINWFAKRAKSLKTTAAAADYEKAAKPKAGERGRLGGCQTIGGLLGQLARLQDVDDISKGADALGGLVGTGAQFEPVTGLALGVSSMLAQLGRLINGDFKDDRMQVRTEEIKDFPILKFLNIEAALVENIDNDLLNVFDDDYQDYVKGLEIDPEMCVDDLMGQYPLLNINTFIREKLKGVCQTIIKTEGE